MTKKFKKIRQAINYNVHCPFCRKELFINEKDAVIISKNGSPTLRFNLMGEDSLLINLETEKIDLELRQTISSYGYFNYGINYYGINIGCVNSECGLFDFTIQLQIDIDKSKINEVILNSERISFEDKHGVLHEIKNIYVNNITEYICYSGDEAKVQKMPILTLDMKKPQKTVDRIKKLILFS